MNPVFIKLAVALAAAALYVTGEFFPEVKEALHVLAGTVGGLLLPQVGKAASK